MVSDYFFVKNNEAEVANRIQDLKDYVWYRIVDMVDGNSRRVVIDHNYFWYSVVEQWTSANRVKVDMYDWKYILYLCLKDHGIYVSYADCSLSISLK